ncbi:hypothetical protein F5Y18DRAFT_376496 [Xylariaceae sp. FL1019]|nr:hypothetical protein F5Y18DRAFT_376496 [Xylariaceae sp. FL1019]
MTAILGKRKSRTQRADPSISQQDAQAVFARLFEQQFLPLAPVGDLASTSVAEDRAAENDDEDDEDGISEGGEDDDSWDGLSEDDDQSENSAPPDAVEVVAHTEAYTTKTIDPLDKRESRAWLSSKPPTYTSSENTTSTKTKKAVSTTEEDAPSLLKNDLALQRLLSESHLFSSAAAKSSDKDSDDLFGGHSTEHVGRNRHLATDMRLGALGSKSSIYKQAKMPMSFRKGIIAAAEGKESKRRREAKENGVVLERPGPKKNVRDRRKSGPRDIDAPAVGRMNNGLLKLSKRDIASVEGPKKGATFAKKRRR